MASSHVGHLWISGYCKNCSSPPEELYRALLICSSVFPGELSVIWDKIQENSWEIVEKIAIRERDRLTCCFLS